MPYTWDSQGHLVPFSPQEEERQLVEAQQAFDRVTVTRPEPKPSRIDTSLRGIFITIWRGLMESAEIVLGLNRWWPGRRDGPR